MLRPLLLLLILLATLHTAARGDSLTLMEQTALLPSPAQNFLRKHFATLGIKKITVENRFLHKEYSVLLAGGGSIEFDGRGNWTRIEGLRHALPASTIPSKIQQYIRTHYPHYFIASLDRTAKGYQTGLRGLEENRTVPLLFNRRYELVEEDDEPLPLP